MKFQFFVAGRYLRARSRQAVISVVTLVSVAGVAAGVMALHIALALNEGLQQEFLTRILGATSHLNVRSLTSSVIKNYPAWVAQLEQIDEVVSATPTVSGYALLESALREQPAIIRGVDLADRREYQQVIENVKSGTLEGFDSSGRPSIILGAGLAEILSVKVGDRLTAIGTRGSVSAIGRMPRHRTFEIIAIYETGLWDYDTNLALVSIPAAQSFYDYDEGQANLIELRIEDRYRSEEVAERLRQFLGEGFQVQTWVELNRPLFAALRLEKLGLMIAIGLIVLVAALNIVSTLTLMVTEKGRDIAIITAMGGSARTINGIFMLQGVIIGIVGAVLGTILGVAISLYLDASQAIPLDPQVYQIAYVPFRVQFSDGLLIGLFSVLISFLATLYPARAAARLDPVVALRND
ncbi:MAG TPA: FtsX-like permease family protein [Acidobacteriota bacterium]|nr:FtsX-like permease family protein [Acidobacteriota bacterium]